MRDTHSGRVIAAVAFFTIAAALAGCRQPQQSPTPGEKQARLLAAENMQLKKQVAEQQKQCEADEYKYVQELGEKQQELTQCQQRVEQLQKEIQEGIAQRVNDVTAKVMDENARLRQELETLRAEIERLKGQLRPAEPNQPQVQ